MGDRKEDLMQVFILLLISLLFASMGQGQQITASQYIMNSGIPTGISSASATIVGNPGNTTYYYWVIADTEYGYVYPNAPIIVRNAPNVLSVSNYVRLDWTPSPFGLFRGFVVIRTTSNQQPNVACTACAISASYLTVNAINDDGTALVDSTDFTRPARATIQTCWPISGNGSSCTSIGSTYPEPDSSWTVANSSISMDRLPTTLDPATYDRYWITYFDGNVATEWFDAGNGNPGFGVYGAVYTSVDGLDPEFIVQAGLDYDPLIEGHLRLLAKYTSIENYSGTQLLLIPSTGIIQPSGGYASSDGTAGVTVTTCTSFKDGICVAGTP